MSQDVMQLYKPAMRTSKYWQDQLIRDHPNIVAISPQVDTDENDNPTTGVIVITVKNNSHPIPDRLLDVETNQYISVRVERGEEAIAC